jgi:pimeloyl-ACP methyl ester carboxylesterase
MIRLAFAIVILASGCQGKSPASASSSPPSVSTSPAPPPAASSIAVVAPPPPSASTPTPPANPGAPPAVEEEEVGAGKKVYVVRGAHGPHLGVFLHGLCGHPKAYLDTFPNQAARYGAFIAPNGDAPCNGPYRSWTGKTELLDVQITEGLAKAGAKGELVDVTLVGYSMGGTRALALAKRWPDRYTKLILLGTPDTPSPRGLDKVKSAVMMAGTRDRSDKMKAGVRAFEKAGSPSIFMPLPGAAHGEMGPEAERVMGEALDWVEAHQRKL